MLKAPRFIDFNLQRLRFFFDKINNIHNQLDNIIHIAGTNGKGSTVSFCRYILQEHGFTTNVFISPHLVNFNERIRIKNSLISNNYLNEIINILSKIKGFDNLTIFEQTFAIACFAFYQNKANFNIIEAGVGGRLDATNIIKDPIISIISNIDYDHQNFLGNNILEIAFEKACIAKVNSLTVKSLQTNAINNVFINYCNAINSTLLLEGVDYKIIDSVLFYKEFNISLKVLGLAGKHQEKNAALACVSCINAMLKNNIQPNKNLIEQALKKTEWPARLQKIPLLYNFKANLNDEIYLDGAHNPNGAKVLSDFIKNKAHKFTEINIVIGMLAKKDLEGFLKEFALLQNYLHANNIKCVITFYPVEILNHDSYTKQDIFNKCLNLNLHVEVKKNIQDICKNFANSTNTKLIIVCGSLYMLGEVLKDNNIEVL